MSWFRRAITKTARATSSSGILMDVIRGANMEQSTAIQSLMILNDPETCNNIGVLMNDPGITSAFPNATSTLSAIGFELNCFGEMINNDANDANQIGSQDEMMPDEASPM